MIYVGSSKNSEFNPDEWLSGIHNYGSLEKQTAPDLNWKKLLIHSNGNIFAIASPGFVYLQSSGAGSFNALATSLIYATGICEDVITGDVYVTYNGVSGNPSSSGVLRISSDGATIESMTFNLTDIPDDTYARYWNDCIGTASGNVYASTSRHGGYLWKLNKTSDQFKVVTNSKMESGRAYGRLMEIDGNIYTTYIDSNSNNQLYPYYQGVFLITTYGLASVSFNPNVSGVGHYTTITNCKTFNGNIYVLFSGNSSYMEFPYLYSLSGGVFVGNDDYSLWNVTDLAFHLSGVQIITVGEYSTSYPGALYFRSVDGILFTIENTMDWKCVEFYGSDVYCAVNGGGIYRMRAA